MPHQLKNYFYSLCPKSSKTAGVTLILLINATSSFLPVN
jgi:hypothetical protein